MSSTTHSGSTFVAAVGLKRLAAFGASGLALSGLSLGFGIGLPCPWRWATGTLCPLCGSTQLGVYLLQGDVSAAFAANPFVFALLASLTVLGILWTVEVSGGPALRLPSRFRPTAHQWLLALAVLGFGFAVLRNVLTAT